MTAEDALTWDEIDDELKKLGYQHHAFLSFARGKKSPRNLEVAKAFRTAIVEELQLYVESPEVFIDEEMQPGDLWSGVLAEALGKSVCLVAVCIPLYFSPKKQWCGREWAGMNHLSKKRLPSASYRTIIPMLVRADPPLPSVLTGKEGLQYEDFSAMATATTEELFLKTPEAKRRIQRVVQRMKAFAYQLVKDGKPSADPGFDLPDESPFANERECAPRPLFGAPPNAPVVAAGTGGA